MLLFSPHHKFAISSSRDASLRSVKALILTSRPCISYQQRCANAAAGVLPLVLGSSAVRHAQHICAASSQPEQPQVQVAVLQDPSNAGNAACYVVGVSPDGGIPALNQVERLILDLRAQAPQQEIVLLLDPTAATAAVNNDASFAEQAAAAGVKWQGDQSSGELQTYLRMLNTAHLVQVEMQLPVDGNVRSELAAGPPSEPSTVSSSSSSSKSGSTSLSSLLASGLGFARRTANAAVSAVEAAAAAAAAADAAESEEAEQSGVDLVPDLPDLSLRMRRRDWDPEQAVLSWHAAVLFCAMIKQLQDQGYEVELRDDDEFSPDMPKHIQEAIPEAAFEEARQHDTFHSFEIIKLLLTQAADSLQQKQPAIGEEEMQHWIALLMAAEDPKVVVVELESLLEEQIAEHAALQEAGQEPPVVLLPTAFDVAQRLDAKYANGEGSDGDSGSGDDGSDSDGEEEGNTEEGEQIQGEEEGKGPGSGSGSSSTEARLDAEAGAGYVVKGLPAEPKDAIRIGSGSSKTDDAAPSSSSSSSRGSAAAGDAARRSSGSLDASDAVINARSNRQLVDAMMRLERSWNQAKEASTGSSSSSSGSSSSKGGSSKQGDKSVPELLPRPIRPPQPRGDAADSSSSSSSAAGSSTGSVSSSSTSSSRRSSSGRSRSSPGSTEQSEQGAAVAGSGSSTAGSRIRRINRQAGPPAVASAAAGVEDPSAASGTSSSSSSGASGAADAAAAAADGAATVAGADAAAAVGDSSNSSQSAGRSDTMSSSTAGDKQQQGRASEELPGRSAAQEQPQQQQQQQGSAARSAGTPDNTGNSEPLRDQGADSAAAEADAQSIILGSEPQRLQQCEEVPLLRLDDDAQLQRLVDERAAAVARSAAAAGGSGSRAAVAAAAAAGDEGAAVEVDAAAFAQHIRDSFSQFEDYLASTGVELSREARIEAFTEIYEDDFDSDDELDELADAAERAAGGPWEHAQSWFQPEWWHAVIAGILYQDPASSSSSSGEAAAVPTDLDGKASKGQQQGSKGSQGIESLAARSNSSRSSGSNDGSSNGWDHIRSNFGQDGVDRLRDLLRGDSLLMTGVDINEMTILIAALNNLNHGERLSTAELRMVSRLLKEAEPDAESNSSSGGAADASAKSDKARKRQRGGTSSRRSSSLTRPPGFNVSAKDTPYKQDTRAIRLPKPYGRKRREQVQLFLKQLRQQQQQRKLVRQQRATQLQLWRLQHELLQGQQQQQQQQTGADGQQQQQQNVLSQPLAASSSSSSAGSNAAGSSRRSRFAEAFKGFTAAWRQSMKDQAAAEQQQRQLDELQAQQAAAEHQQQQQRQASLRVQLFAAAVAERSGLSAEDVHAAADWVKQLRENMAAAGANAPVYIAVVPQQQLQLIETAWQQGTGSEGVCNE